jgi:hypothetical protein
LSKLITTDISKYYASLEDAREDYAVVKCWSVVQFYTIIGRKSVIIKENFTPITYVLYVIFSPAENKYYLRSFRNIPIDDLYFYEFDNKLNFEDTSIEQLRRYVYDGNVYLLLRAEQVESTKQMLARISKANLTTGKVIKYKDFILLCDISLKREYHNEYNKSKDGFKTELNILDSQIANIWQKV